MAYPQTHPLRIRVENIHPEYDLHGIECKSGNEMDMKVATHSGDMCLFCDKPIEKDTLYIGLYRYRFGMGHGPGKWHRRCFSYAVEAAPDRKTFCWLTGKTTTCKAMPLQQKNRCFTATEASLKHWFYAFDACKDSREREQIKYNQRKAMLEPTIEYWIAKEEKKAKKFFQQVGKFECTLKTIYFSDDAIRASLAVVDYEDIFTNEFILVLGHKDFAEQFTTHCPANAQMLLVEARSKALSKVLFWYSLKLGRSITISELPDSIKRIVETNVSLVQSNEIVYRNKEYKPFTSLEVRAASDDQVEIFGWNTHGSQWKIVKAVMNACEEYNTTLPCSEE